MKQTKFGGWLVVCGLAVAMASCGDDTPGTLPDAPEVDVPPTTAQLTIDRATASFGSITLNTTSPATTFTITNTGNVAAGMLATSLGGTDAASFGVGANTCTGSLAPAATCTIAVTFAPMAVGTKTATLSVTGMPGGTVTAALDGEGVGVGALTISSNISALGSVVVGQTGTAVATFTVTNTGAGTTGALSVFASGSDPADFVKSNDTCSTMTLAAAATCTFQVRIAPLTPGAKSALYQVTASPGGNVSGAVTGTGLAPASLRGVPLQLEFGTVVVAQTSASLTVTIANLGGVASGALAQSVTGDFAISGGTCNGTMLNGGTTCTVTLTFTPTAAGNRTGTLTITGAPGGTVVTSLVGDGIAAGGLTISPSTHQFANTNVGQTATSRQFTITNTGSVATGALTTAIGGGNASQFQIIAGTDACTGLALAPAGTCTISVTFAPTMGGVAHASLTVAGAPGGAVTASLLGLGVGPAALTIAPPSRAFGSVVVGSMSPPLTFTVQNLGGQVSGIPAASLTGAGAASFAIAGNTCTATLAPGASCTVQVRFNPTATGAVTASLQVAATPGGTVNGALSGDGIAAGGIVILPSNTTFPVTAVGDTAATQTLSVLNTGTAATSAITIALPAGDFTQTNNCTTLAVNATCTITVTFAPSASGNRTATVTASASTGGTATAALAGTGRPRLEIIALNSGPVVSPADFGTAIVNNSTPHDVQILVRNNTSTSKTFGVTGSFGFPAQYAVVANTCGTTIGAAGGLCTIGIRFAPTTTGTKTGMVTFDIGTGAQNQAVQALTGVGTDALFITAVNGTDFGSIPINTAAVTLQFRITNPAGSVTSGVLDTMLAGGAAFTITMDACDGQTLVAGASCLVVVSFAPTTVGAAMTTLSAMATPGGMPTINISGTGVSPIGAVPTDITLSPSSIAEGTPVGSTVGALTTTDADVTDTHTYSFVGGAGSTDNSAFTISGANVNTAGILDYEVKSSYAVRVRTTDSGGNIFEKALTITVTNVDEPPVAVDDAITVTEDDPATAIDVLANDTDIDAGPKMITSVTQPAGGMVVVTGGGTGLTYKPNMDFAGGDTFTYTLNGGSLATVTVTVTAVDDAPVAVNDTFTVAEDSGANALDVLANDTDVDAGPISITAITQPAHGTLAITGGGTGVTYTPTARYSGADSFTYTLSPGGSTATVSITVTAVDDPPVAVDDAVSGLEDSGPVFVNVIANDTDVDAGPMMVTSFTQGAHGTVTAFQNGVNYSPAPDYYGPDTFTYTLNGGSTATVTYTVIPVNDVPKFTKGANQTHLEDAGAQTIASWATMISPGPANEVAFPFPQTGGQQVDFIVTNDNTTLFSVQPAISPTGTLTYTLAADENGVANVTVRIHDDGGTTNGGVDTSAAQTFTITVTPVNDVPSFTKGGDQTVNEDAGAQTVNNWATSISKGPANESSQVVDFQITNNTNPTLFSAGPAVSPTGTLTYTPAANEFGTATITIRIHDDGGTANGGVDTSATQTFVITVNSVNDAPSFTKGANQVVDEDSGAHSIANWATNISKGPGNESGQVLNFVIDSNSDSSLFTAGGQPAVSPTGTLTYTPAGNQFGTATITLHLHDDGGTANGGVDDSPTQTFTITISSVNDAPSFTKGADQTVLEDAGMQTVAGWATAISPGPANESGQSVMFNVTGNTNAGLFAAAPAIMPNGTLTYTPALNANGSATITITLQDNGGTAGGGVDTSTPQSFVINVTAVNDEPTINVAGNQTVNEDAGAQTVASFATSISPGIPANESGQTLTLTVNNDNNALFSVQPSINPANGTLTYTPGPTLFGSATVTVTLQDNGGTANGGDDTIVRTFTITVNSVNDAPSFTQGTDPVVNEDSGAFSATWATAISVGPANEAGQTITFNLTGNTNPSLFSAGPSIASNGTLTFTPAPNAFGSAAITVAAQDNGGTANGGVDTSTSVTLLITVNPVNDTPAFTKGGNETVFEDTGLHTVSGWATNISAGPANESTQILTFNVSNDNNGLFSTQPAINPSTGTLSYTLAANAFGSTTVTVTLSDNGGTTNGGVDTSGPQTFTITVTGINDAPSFNLGTAITVLEDSGANTTAGWANAMNVGPNESQTFVFNVSNDNNGLFGSQPAIDTSGQLTFTPAANAFGSATVTVIMQDNGGTANGGVDSSTKTFTISVTPVNDPPSFTPQNLTVNEDAGATTQQLTTAQSPGPGETGQTITFNITGNTNAGLFSAGPSINGSGQITYTPASNANGVATITVTASDNGGTANGGIDTSGPQTFTITVNPVNDPPTFTGGGDVSVDEDSGLYSATWASNILVGGGADESGQTPTFVIDANTNSGLFATGPTIASNGVLSFTPAANVSGVATITVHLSDGGGTANGGDETSAQVMFMITVDPVNDEPTFTSGGNISVIEDFGPYSAAWATGISAGPLESQSLMFNVTGNTNSALFASGPSIASNGTLSFTPAVNAFGTATITVVLQDNGGTGNGGDDTSGSVSFDITVTPVNDPPSFTAGGNVSVNEDSGVYSMIWGTSVSTGPANEVQTPLFNVSNDNNALFSSQPAIDSSGVLTFTPGADLFGSATVSVSLTDGIDTTATVTFTITVNSVDDPPTANDDSATVAQNAAATSIDVLANDLNADGGLLQIQSATDPVHGTVVVNVMGNGLTYQPDLMYCDDSTPDTFVYTLNGGDTATVSVTVTCPAGAPIWTGMTQFGGSDQDLIKDMVRDGAGNLYLAGFTQSASIFGESSLGGTFDATVMKLDPNGNLVWGHRFGGSGDDFAYAIAVGPGGVYVTGQTNSSAIGGSPSNGGNDAFAVRFDSNGNQVAARLFGSTTDDVANIHGVVLTTSGDVVVSGYSFGSFGGATGHGGSDVMLAQLTGDLASITWTRLLGGAADELGAGIDSYSNGDLVLVGHASGSQFGVSSGLADQLVMRLDSGGNIIWSNLVGGASFDYAFDVVARGDGGATLVGMTQSATFAGVGPVSNDATIASFSGVGVLEWARTLGGSGVDAAYAVANDGIGGTLLVGIATSVLFPTASPANGYALVAGYDGNGNLTWGRQFGGIQTDELWGVAVDASRNVYVGGHTGNNLGSSPAGSFDVLAAQLRTGNATRLDGGANGHVTLPPTNLYMNSAGFSWEMWIRMTVAPSSTSAVREQTLFSTADGAACEDVYLGFGTEFTQGRALAFNVDGAGGCGARDSSAINYFPAGGWQTGHWYHVVGVRDFANNAATLYVDGVQVASKPFSGAVITRAMNANLGRWFDGGTNIAHFSGAIDEVRLYGRPLSAIEVAAHYNGGSGAAGSSSDVGLAAGYHLDTGTGTTASDYGANLLNGTFASGASWVEGVVHR